MQEVTSDVYIPVTHSAMCHPYPVSGLKRKNKPTFSPSSLERE